MEENLHSIIMDFINSVVEEICDLYCKYSNLEDDPELGCKKECLSCPLNKLVR